MRIYPNFIVIFKFSVKSVKIPTSYYYVSRTQDASRDRSRRKKNMKKTHNQKKIKRKIDFSNLRNPQKTFYAAVWRGRKI